MPKNSVIILGAGMAGCLAALEFPNAHIHEVQEEPNIHKAVLRFRSDQISKLTGIPFKKVTVHKAIYFNGKFVECNPLIANLYSQKVTGSISDRSVWNTDSVTRWIAPVDFHSKMMGLCKSRIKLGSKIDIKRETQSGTTFISTLPMPVIAKAMDEEVYCSQSFSPIKVTTVLVKDCDAYQTIYFPNGGMPVYRATLEGDRLIIEAIEDIADTDIRQVLQVFGINHADVIDFNYTQRIGKIDYNGVEKSKEFLYTLTSKYNIYSLGRSALWRNVLLDDAVQDIQCIKEMMAKTAYQLRLGK